MSQTDSISVPDVPLVEQGDSLLSGGQYVAAADRYRQAIDMGHASPQLFNNLGVLLHHRGETSQAIHYFQKAIEADDQYPDAQLNLALTYQDLGSHQAALLMFQRIHEAMSHNPSFLPRYSIDQTMYQIAGCQYRTGQHKEAIRSLEQLVSMKPEWHEPYINLGDLLWGDGQFERAAQCYLRALEGLPHNHELHVTAANSLILTGKSDIAQSILEQCIEQAPGNAVAHMLLGTIYLSNGEFDRGWREYEWIERTGTVERRDYRMPAWRGESLEGKTLLVYTEDVYGNGFGDTIQYIRYLPLLKAKGARIVLVCQSELSCLFDNLNSIDLMSVHPRGSRPSPLTIPCDYRVSLMTLPARFHSHNSNIPVQVPYLTVDDNYQEKWKAQLPKSSGLRVGIVWAASDLGIRSCGLQSFLSLAQLPGLTLFSLQTGQSHPALSDTDIIDLQNHLLTFEDTAAAILNLDLVITVDTAVAHLAGALGRPVWTLLPLGADWKWQRCHSDTHWYPTMRLFRQKRFNHWTTVFQEVSLALMQTIDDRKFTIAGG